jgi:hypothetical protein
MNLPCLKAWALKGLMVLLINDMGLVPRGWVERQQAQLRQAYANHQID